MKLWKRLSAAMLAVTIFLGLLPFAAAADQLDTSGPLYAGYAKIRIDPASHPDGPITGLPMPGYGASTDRLSTGGKAGGRPAAWCR